MVHSCGSTPRVIYNTLDPEILTCEFGMLKQMSPHRVCVLSFSATWWRCPSLTWVVADTSCPRVRKAHWCHPENIVNAAWLGWRVWNSYTQLILIHQEQRRAASWSRFIWHVLTHFITVSSGLYLISAQFWGLMALFSQLPSWSGASKTEADIDCWVYKEYRWGEHYRASVVSPGFFTTFSSIAQTPIKQFYFL